MKKTTLTILTILILALTACSGTSNTSSSTPLQPTDGTAPELSTVSKLVVGSFKLEDTDLAITSEQAIELLPVWQVYQEVSTSDTAAQAEIDALIEQAQETLTSKQMDAINAMNLTQQDVFTIMQERGIQFGGGQNIDRGSGSQNGDIPSGGFQGGGGFPGGDGGFPGGAPPDGGGFPGGDFGGGAPQGLSEDQIATAQASRPAGRGNTIPPMLINALIELLKLKAGS